MSNIIITNEDCMDLLKRTPDNYYDLAICDPPYGINFAKTYTNRTTKDKRGERHKSKDWDNSIPSDKYFKELLRVSKNQIVWGGNYFKFLAKKETPNLKTINEFSRYIKESDENWIFWYKQNPVPNFADGELAWISFKGNNQFNFRYYGNLQGNTSADNKIHPTQKPVQLYKWLLENYAKEGDKILDTHLGSGSIAIACHDYKFDLVGCEIDKDYYDAAVKRFNNHKAQIKLF